MARVLILSSYVAASRVGGGAQALALARLEIEPILVPTAVLGRHPGHGPPGGAALEPAVFESVLGGVEASGGFAGLDAVITGHFSSAAQVAVAAEALQRVRAASPRAIFVVDPIMGDADKGLYVREPVAEAIAAELVPMADVITPNTWELARLSGLPVSDPASAVTAARALGKPMVVTSVSLEEAQMGETDMGSLYVSDKGAWLARHAEFGGAPKGTGDLLTALFTACLIDRMPSDEAVLVATSGVVDAIERGNGAPELAIRHFPTELMASRWVLLEQLDG